MVAKSGADAVGFSVQQNSMQSNARAAVAESDADNVLVRNTANNQFIGNRNFVNESGVWIDAEYSETSRLPVSNIRFASDEYFALIERDRGIAQYLSLGEQVVVIWKNRVYRITN